MKTKHPKCRVCGVRSEKVGTARVILHRCRKLKDRSDIVLLDSFNDLCPEHFARLKRGIRDLTKREGK